MNPLKEIRMRDKSNNSILIFASLRANASPSFVEGSSNAAAGVAIITNGATATGLDGSPPYSYAWSQSGSDVGWTALAPNSATTAFRRSNVLPGSTEQTGFICTVTDSSGATATTPEVTASVTNVNGS